MAILATTIIPKNQRLSEKIPSWLVAEIKPNILAIGLILIHLVITLFLAKYLNIWIDEAYSLEASGQNLAHGIDRATSGYQPPLYYLILNLWRTLNDSIFFARLFSIICIALTIYIVAKLSQRLFQDIHPAWIVATVAFNPFTIWAAVEIRAYALTLLLSTLLLLYFFDGYLCEQPKTTARRWYVIFSILGLYTHYYIAFLLIANGCAILVLRRWQTLRWYVLDQLLVGLCFAPMLFVISGQVQPDGLRPHPVTGNLLIENIRFIYQRFFIWILPTEKWGLYAVQRTLRMICFLTLLSLLIKNRRSVKLDRRSAICIVTVILFLFFLGVRNTVGTNVTGGKHLLITFIPSILSLFCLFDLSKHIEKTRIIKVWTAIALFVSLSSLYFQYKPMAKHGDFIRVAAYLKNREEPGQTILLYNPEMAWPLRYYYSGANSLAILPRELNLDLYFDVKQFVLKDEQEIFEALGRVSENNESLWIVLDTRPYLTSQFPESYQVMENFIQKYYQVETTKNFHESQVRLLRQKPTKH